MKTIRADDLDGVVQEFIFQTKTSPGGAFPRACAFFIDAAIVGAVSHAVYRVALHFVPPLSPAMAALGFSTKFVCLAVAALFFAVAFWLWDAVWLSFAGGATPGKFALGLRVVSSDAGKGLGFGRSAKRAALKLVPAAKSAVLAVAAVALAVWAARASSWSIPGPDFVRRALPVALAIVCCAPLVPNYSGVAWLNGRRYFHDVKARTLVRAPLVVKWWTLPARVAVLCALAAAVAGPGRRAALRAVRLPAIRTYGETRDAIGKFFAPRFAGSPIKLLDAKVVFPEDCVSVAGAIACATNCTGSLVVGAHGRTAELPFEARLVDGEWKAMFAAPPAKTFRELLIARKPAKPGESDDGGDVATAGSAAPAKRLAPIRPGKTGVSSDGLEIFFSGVELLPWPADAVPRDGAFLAAFDLVIVNKGDSPAFVADWDFKCAYDSGKRRMRQVWLESFRSIQSQLNPGQKASGTVLFALPTAPGTIGLSGHGLTFEAEFAGRKPGRGK